MSESGTPTSVSGTTVSGTTVSETTVQRERVSVAPTSIEWTREFVQQWLEAWNSHEADRLLALMTDDIEYRDDSWQKTMRGHADVREFLDATWRATPDMTFELLAGPYVIPGEPRAAFHWRGWGTHTGLLDPPGFAATGRRWELDGADFLRVPRRARLQAADCVRHDERLPPARADARSGQPRGTRAGVGSAFGLPGSANDPGTTRLGSPGGAAAIAPLPDTLATRTVCARSGGLVPHSQARPPGGGGSNLVAPATPSSAAGSSSIGPLPSPVPLFMI